jgi:hypothetical protein
MSSQKVLKFRCNRCGEERIVHFEHLRPAEKYLCTGLQWEKLGTNVHLCPTCKTLQGDKDDILA